MPTPLVQSAVNVSEGRRDDVLRTIVESASAAQGVALADWSADPDHNRMVVTLLGPPEAVGAAAVSVARAALAHIDLRAHVGAHPRLGAVDVIPFVPIRSVSMAECVDLSMRVGSEIGRDLQIPVYLYERSARPGRSSALPDIRKGGFEGLFITPLLAERRPDFGPANPHPSAGAVIIGAREPLVAYNVNLDSGSKFAALRVAARIRAERGDVTALTGVRALGVWVESRQLAQVSMNLTNPAATTLAAVFDFVEAAANELGTRVAESEVIGLVPKHCLGEEPPERIKWAGFRESRILEYWLERL